MITLEQSGNQVKLSGELDFETVAEQLRNPSIRFDAGDLSVDLCEISRFNSASLALLLEWMKIAQQKGSQIKYHNAPEQLMAIARAYGLDQELPLTSA